MIRRQHLLAVFAVSILMLVVLYLRGRESPIPLPTVLPSATSAGMTVSPVTALGNGRWIRSFRTADGTIYLRGRLHSRDGGQTIEPQTAVDVEDINASPERAILARSSFFYALDGPAEMERPGVYRVRGWRAAGDLQRLTPETVRLEVPEGPRRSRQPGEWFGLYIYRTILEMPDGSWLLTMYGNFDGDTLPPSDRSSQAEVKYMMRSFVLTSHDKGRSWRYLSTIAAPKPGNGVGEGFVEPALTRLADGRLLCILRTGHFYPLYASWSSDGGKTWTAPVETGLDRGCDPCLLTLADGRVALSWGQRFPVMGSSRQPEKDFSLFKYPGEGFLNVALSNDGGATWTNTRIARRTGSCYSVIFEVEPNVLFFQVDQWVWRVAIKPGKAGTNSI